MDLDLEDWRTIYRWIPELDEDGLYEKMLELNSDYLDDERSNLKQPIGQLACYDLGLWNGDIKYRKKPMPTFGLSYYRYDSGYVDRNGEFCGSQHQNNHYVYRKIRTARQMTILTSEAKLYDGTTQKDIDR